jgi:hypothetical protein
MTSEEHPEEPNEPAVFVDENGQLRAPSPEHTHTRITGVAPVSRGESGDTLTFKIRRTRT